MDFPQTFTNTHQTILMMHLILQFILPPRLDHIGLNDCKVNTVKAKMSCLVNYGSSDESDGSDGEDFPSLPAKSKDMDLKAKHADVTPAIPKSSLFASLPKPKGTSTPSMEEVGSESGGSNKKSLFSSLPPPKKTGSANSNSAAKMSAAKPNLAQESTGLLTDNKTGSKGLLNLPPPKKKQPVKISLPALPDVSNIYVHTSMYITFPQCLTSFLLLSDV
nr:uncharacterized protein LOC129261598 [Lytechinus pictus]